MMIKNPDARQAGFTLIELMITLVVVSILAAIAYPAYSDFVRRNKLSDAFANLSDMRLQMEQYYQDNRSYVSAGTTCGVANFSSTLFDFTCTGSATTFTWTAKSKTGQGLGSSAGYYTYTIDQNGNMATPAIKGAAGSNTCWEVRSGQCLQ